MNILFVCAGNMSRSFLAEVLFRHETDGLGRRDVFSSSAGLHAYPGNPPDPVMVEYLQSLGMEVPPHEARMITQEDVERADLILVMEREQVEEISRLWPGVRGKVELLGSYLPGPTGGDDIIDPFGRTPYHYRLAQSQIALGVKSLAQRIVSAGSR